MLSSPSGRRWRRILFLSVAVGAVGLYRNRRLAESTRRYGANRSLSGNGR